jgi:serine/threonine protein kinase
MIIIRGNSGCSVEIKDSLSKKIVRKSSFDPSYYHRLEAQCKKQDIAFQRNNLEFVEIPKVINKEFSFQEDICYFEMDFCRSLDCITFIHRCSIREIEFLISSIVGFVDNSILEAEICKFEKEIFLSKYSSVKNNLKNSKFYNEINNRFSKIDEIFFSLDERDIPVGFCHGDLTLSNILIKRRSKKICLIDFLDTFLESPIQDMVKIRQDTKYMWSLNLYPIPIDLTKVSIIFNYIDKKIDNHFRKYDFYKYFYQSFQIMNLLRLLQYCSSSNIVSQIIQNIDQLVLEKD